VGQPSKLGSYPLCEASALVAAPCVLGKGGTCYFVADNERDEYLFQLRLNAAGLLEVADGDGKVKFDGRDAEVGDIEALIANGRLLRIIGSHGRSKSCAIKKKRLRLAEATLAKGDKITTEITRRNDDENAWKARLGQCADSLIVPVDGAELAMKACRAIGNAEKTAQAYFDTPAPPSVTPTPCKVEPHFNSEGAAWINDRLWLGMRGPLLDETTGKNGPAMLLRLASGTEGGPTSFDAVATIDLRAPDGTALGIRDLAVAGDTLWGIAGSVGDSDVAAHLWRVALDQIRPGAAITGTVLPQPLPPASEGLVLVDKEALIVIDGDDATEASPGRCATDAMQMRLRLPQ
jgi:hypothetical protein